MLAIFCGIWYPENSEVLPSVFPQSVRNVEWSANLREQVTVTFLYGNQVRSTETVGPRLPLPGVWNHREKGSMRPRMDFLCPEIFALFGNN